MADERGVVDGYAEGIFTVARAEGNVDRVEDELYRLARLIDGNAELSQSLTSPGIDVATKLEIIEGMLDGKAHPQTISAVMYVVQSGRARQLGEIVDAVARRAAAARERSIAEVRTAIALDDEHKRRLADALTQATGQQVELKVIVDPDVVGGVLVKMGDTVIDGSIARRLTEMRSVMTGA